MGRRGLLPAGMSTTFSASRPQAASGCSTTQCECQTSPSLSALPSPFSSNNGVSSKSGAADVIEALRLKPTRLYVVKSGKVISRSQPRIGELFLDGRPGSIDPGRDYVPKPA